LYLTSPIKGSYNIDIQIHPPSPKWRGGQGGEVLTEKACSGLPEGGARRVTPACPACMGELIYSYTVNYKSSLKKVAKEL
jgi:hypothetical protein